ncbi:hypothetical protein DOTSEDRAFT_70403 [Dothistroma septosporum NZE10]|uniref:Uncharacterized protein n=1 Tax=Dothistroma septosporum (strain NZE10 / CBS 128990) TaxID=675120 RepID=N1PSF9_DOTSN|nr:hypothetical protein DOTSEDRAFT_70403 [Dothistroma septosporum NZE10]
MHLPSDLHRNMPHLPRVLPYILDLQLLLLEGKDSLYVSESMRIDLAYLKDCDSSISSIYGSSLIVQLCLLIGSSWSPRILISPTDQLDCGGAPHVTATV